MNTQLNLLPQTDGNSDGGAAMPTSEDVSPRTNNVPNISPPSIASSAMLVCFSASQATLRKKDRSASAKVTGDNNAETGVASVNKHLLGDCAELTAVHKFVAKLRNVHAQMTMAWGDMGERLLPTAQYFKYHNVMTAGETEFWSLVNTFLSAYEWERSQAQAKLGDLHNPADYPTLAELERKFAFRLSYIPLPDAGDFRIDVGNTAVAEIKQGYEEYYSANLTDALNEVWTRLHTALTNMSERLDYNDQPEDKKTFRDSLVSNVIDMVEVLDVCNVTGDSQMAALKDKLSSAMYGITAEVLREDNYTRTETKRAVDQIISALPSLEI